jgi:hypothetical protein
MAYNTLSTMGQAPLPGVRQQSLSLSTMGARPIGLPQNFRPTVQDPARDSFAERFGVWNMDDLNKLMQQRDDAGVGHNVPGSTIVDPRGAQGEPFLNWFLQRRI